MKLEIIRIEGDVTTCTLEDGTILDIATRWFNPNIQVGDTIEFDMTQNN